MNLNTIAVLYTNQMLHLGTIKESLKGKRYITQEEYSKITDTFLEVASSIQEQLLVLLGAALIYQQSEQTKNDFKDIFDKLGFESLETLKAATDALYRYVNDINDAIEDIRKDIPRFREDHEVYMQDHSRTNPLTRSCTYYSDNLQDPGLIDPIFNILSSVGFSDFEIRISAGNGRHHYYYKLGDRVDLNLATLRGNITKYLGKAGKRLMKLEGRISGVLPGTNFTFNVKNVYLDGKHIYRLKIERNHWSDCRQIKHILLDLEKLLENGGSLSHLLTEDGMTELRLAIKANTFRGGVKIPLLQKFFNRNRAVMGKPRHINWQDPVTELAYNVNFFGGLVITPPKQEGDDE